MEGEVADNWPFKATGGTRRCLYSTLEWSVEPQHAPGSVCCILWKGTSLYTGCSGLFIHVRRRITEEGKREKPAAAETAVESWSQYMWLSKSSAHDHTRASTEWVDSAVMVAWAITDLNLAELWMEKNLSRCVSMTNAFHDDSGQILVLMFVFEVAPSHFLFWFAVASRQPAPSHYWRLGSVQWAGNMTTIRAWLLQECDGCVRGLTPGSPQPDAQFLTVCSARLAGWCKV